MHYMAWTPLPGTSRTNGSAERMVEAIQHSMWLQYPLSEMSRTFEVNLNRLGADFSNISSLEYWRRRDVVALMWIQRITESPTI